MAKKKQKKQGQQFLSDEKYLKQKARTLEIGKCYITDSVTKVGEGQIVVTRNHTGGKISAGFYLVDTYCLGVKDSFYRLRMESYELEDMIDRMKARECSYDEAHNWIYGAIAYAEEAGIKPDKSFALTKYMLEEDTDDIPLIEYEFGKDGKHLLVVDSQLEASRYLPLMKNNLGEENYKYVIKVDGYLMDEDEYNSQGSGLKMEDLVVDLSKSALIGYSTLMGFDIDKNQDLDDIRKEYIKLVLEDPITVICHLPYEEYCILAKLHDNPSEAGKGIEICFNYLNTFLERLGLAEGDWDENGYYHIRVADDFAQAAIPHLTEVLNYPEYMLKLGVEGIVEGMTNLYGEVSLVEVKQQIKEFLGIDDQMIDDTYNLALGTSLLIDTLLTTLDENKELDNSLSDREVFFISRYGWDDEPAQHRTIMSYGSGIAEKKHFTQKEITMATSNYTPAIPNKMQKRFTKYLKRIMPYRDEDIQEICFNLWYRTMHEFDQDFDENSAEDYFKNEVIGNAKYLSKEKDEAMRYLKEYLDNMPRWTLKGHAPSELSLSI